MQESNTLLKVIVFLVVTVGVPGLTVIALNHVYKFKRLAKLADGWKRAVAVAVAIIVVTGLWLFGLYMGYFELPIGDHRAWVEAWFAVIFSAATVQQLIQGFTKPDQGQQI